MQKNHSNIDASYPEMPIKIAEKTWWVGHRLPDDTFQCHVYLIENGDQSVLIDPGSVLTFKNTLAKIEEIIPFKNIRYFLCQHQDPDITGSLPIIDKLVNRKDALIVSHSRAITLLKHYGLKLPFICVEENDWRLDLGGRELEFIFTPYLHFPGAFCTFDRKTGIMFSSDLFGGFTKKWRLFAKDESYFEEMRAFHEHYMPSLDILLHALKKIEEYPIDLIAPQHGSIIPKRLITSIINKLKNLDCGLYLMSQTSTDIVRLTKLNRLLHDFMETMVSHRDFNDIAKTCLSQIKEVVPAIDLEFHVQASDKSITKIAMVHRTGKKSLNTHLPDELMNTFGFDRKQWLKKFGDIIYENILDLPGNKAKHENDIHFAVIPLFEVETQTVFAHEILYFHEAYKLDQETKEALLQVSLPLSVAVEREIIYRTMEIEKEKFHNQSIRDPLTNLYTRTYMKESVERLFNIHDRNPNASVGIVALDIDHFKSVNDTYGHNAGDQVLKSFADILFRETRKGDIQVRMGGEEFAVFMVCNDISVAISTAERIRTQVEKLRIDGPMKDYKFNVSCGVVMHQQNENVADSLNRADIELYEAKNSGRNKVCSS